MSLSLPQMRSVMAWCYVTTLEVWQDLGKTLFRGQCRWKNYSLWRKQTAHWLCSLLSACINRPLTSHSVILSLKHIVVTASVQIQTNWPSVCRGHAQTNSAARIHLKLPSFTLSLTHPHKQTRYMLRDLASTGPMKLPVSLSLVLETTQGSEIPFSQKPRVKPPLGMSFSWQRAEVEHKCDCVCAVCMGLEVGLVLGAKFCRTGAKLLPWGKNRAPCLQKVRLVGMKSCFNKSRGGCLLCAAKRESTVALQSVHSLPHFFTVSLRLLWRQTWLQIVLLIAKTK